MSDDDVYILAKGAELAPEGLDELDTISQALYWIGFRTDVQRNNIISDSFVSYDDIRLFSEKDISNMASDWSSRQASNGKIIFGTRRTKLVKAFTHWVQDFYRISREPSVDGLNEASFLAMLNRALARSEIRKNIKDQNKTAAEAASPGPLKSEREFKNWEEKFINYASAHLGANGIPLSYVIRENEDPPENEEYTDFVSMTISCAPLKGEFYEADRLSVYNMLVSFTTGHPSGDWLKSTSKYSDGRKSMKALRDHFTGEGNVTRNMAEADRLKENLHYKGERSMDFETFLTQCQKMFNIYEKEGEEMGEDAKIRFLFKKIQHQGLKGSIEALKAQQVSGSKITYTMVTNHLATAVSELPEYISKNRNISASSASTVNHSSTIYDSKGNIITGFIPNWNSLSREERAKVFAERKRLGKKGVGTKSQSHCLKQLREQNKKYKRQIASLKNEKKEDLNKEIKSEDQEKHDDIDAGDQFGGREKKKAKKLGL